MVGLSLIVSLTVYIYPSRMFKDTHVLVKVPRQGVIGIRLHRSIHHAHLNVHMNSLVIYILEYVEVVPCIKSSRLLLY